MTKSNQLFFIFAAIASMSLSALAFPPDEKEKNVSEQKASKYPGSINFWLEAREDDTLKVYSREDNEQKKRDSRAFSDFSLQPMIQGSPKTFYGIFGKKACKKIGFRYLQCPQNQCKFTQIPSGKRLYEILSKTKSFHDRFILSQGIVSSREFLQALAKGAVVLTAGECAFSGKVEEIPNGLSPEDLIYHTMIHDMLNHCGQAVLPDVFRLWMMSAAESIITLVDQIEKEHPNDKELLLLLKAVENEIVAYIDGLHGTLTNRLASLLLSNSEDWTSDSFFNTAAVFSGLFFGYHDRIHESLIEIAKEEQEKNRFRENAWYSQYHPAHFETKKKACNVGQLTLSESFINFIVSGIYMALDEDSFSDEAVQKLIELARSFAESLDSEVDFTVNISPLALFSFMQIQDQLADEIEEVLSMERLAQIHLPTEPFGFPVLTDPGRHAPPLPQLIHIPNVNLGIPSFEIQLNSLF